MNVAGTWALVGGGLAFVDDVAEVAEVVLVADACWVLLVAELTVGVVELGAGVEDVTEADEDVTAVVEEWLDPPQAAINSVIGNTTKISAKRLTAPA